MAITYQSLLVGARKWHTGSGTITYSILSSESDVPSYYPTVNRNGVDYYDTYHNDPTDYLPINATLSNMNVGLVRSAVQAWNDVAKVNMVPGTVRDATGTTGTPIAGTGTLVRNLGGAAGFGEIVVPRNDDGSTSYSLTSVFGNGINFFGDNYTSMYVNTNGSISFTSGISTYTPTTITGGSTPISFSSITVVAETSTRSSATRTSHGRQGMPAAAGTGLGEPPRVQDGRRATATSSSFRRLVTRRRS